MITAESSGQLERQTADQFVAEILRNEREVSMCLTSSLQVEDMVVLHMLRQHMSDIPVIFLDTGYHFAQTYAYRDRMVQEWSINLVNVLPEKTVAEHETVVGKQYMVEPTKCCGTRKVAPLMRSLEPFDLWFTGLRREQSPTRANLKKVEEQTLPTGKKLWKLSPLADWSWQQVWDYADAHAIPHLSLYDQSYRSIGCEPCTQLSTDPNNPRAGRWGGRKLECGIHTFSGNSVAEK